MIDEAAGIRSSAWHRRAMSMVAVAAVIGVPAYRALSAPHGPGALVQVLGAPVLVGLAWWVIIVLHPASRLIPVPALAVALALGIALFVTGGDRWLASMAVAGALCGLRSTSPRWAAIAAGATAITGFAVSTAHHYSLGNTVSAIIIGPLATMFAYSASLRYAAVESLRRTRAELARAAVAEERLRIARDLHDLLGHSLSLITLKAELAGRLVPASPERAVQEIGELEQVARTSLADVRAAVAGFRQPDLAGELAAARQLLAAAGIATEVTADTGDLTQDVDAALAWAVREGTTNVVRHSRATRVAIQVSRTAAAVTVEVMDNGPAVPRADTEGGSGLAGLAERVRGLGGELTAGSLDHRGFLLHVTVPVRAQARRRPEPAE